MAPQISDLISDKKIIKLIVEEQKKKLAAFWKNQSQKQKIMF